MSSGFKRSQGVERVIAALLKTEIATKRARSINYQMGIAKLPLAKELADLTLEETPINGELIELLTTGAFLDSQRNVNCLHGPPRRAASSGPNIVSDRCSQFANSGD